MTVAELMKLLQNCQQDCQVFYSDHGIGLPVRKVVNLKLEALSQYYLINAIMLDTEQ